MKKFLLLYVCCALAISDSLQGKTRKAIYIVIDGVAADNIERLHPKTITEIRKTGQYSRAYCGGEVGMYSETPTISAIGYANLLTGTWMNKHNVKGNSNIEANYNYWNLFRIAKEQKGRNYKTALFSSWTDNRLYLLGEGKEDNAKLKIDYVHDGYDRDKVHFPKRPHRLEIYAYDSVVCRRAAECIRQEAPDFSWVYLWYTDAAYHAYGNGSYTDQYVLKEDADIGLIWEAVKYREKNFDEEWLFIVTTDHGRNENGFGHGKQNSYAREVWFATNQKKVNKLFSPQTLSHVDLNPTICRWMDWQLPQDVRFEQDGHPFMGKIDLYDLKCPTYDKTVQLKWKHFGSSETATVYLATDNRFAEGQRDEWIQVGTVPVKAGKYSIDLSKFPDSKFYKIVVETRNNHVTRWLK
ncbi:MAG: alkaline phosphatase family protein [Bacteroidaceae bacterium]|nr:alkaline phosphatase family protein [Bacteroidaceae bacterium]